LVFLEQADAEAQRLKTEMNDTQSENTQSLQHLRAENVQATMNLQQINLEHVQLQEKHSALTEQIAQLKQQLETTVSSSHNLVAWSDIQPVLQGTYTNLLSGAHSIWSTMDAQKNKQLAKYLPGSDAFQGSWLDQNAPLDTMASSAAQPDQFPSLG
jgi:hypothetical protein